VHGAAIGRRYPAALAILVTVAAVGRWNESLYASSAPAAFRAALRRATAVLSDRAVRTSRAQHVYLLKTHKCASTTVQCIVLTYATRNILSVPLPTESINNFYPETFSVARAKSTSAHPLFDSTQFSARALDMRSLPTRCMWQSCSIRPIRWSPPTSIRIANRT